MIVLVPVCHRREPRDLGKNIPEGIHIHVSHIIHHFIHCFPARLQLLLRHFYPHPLHIFKYRIVRGSPEPPFKCPSA